MPPLLDDSYLFLSMCVYTTFRLAGAGVISGCKLPDGSVGN